jgi:hypothetical protein
VVTATTDEAHQNSKGTKMDTETTPQPTARQVIDEFIKDSNTEQIAERMVQQMERINYLQRAWDSSSQESKRNADNLHKLREYLRDRLKELMDGDKDATVELQLEDFNHILDNVGARMIAFTWSVDITATVTITGIEADTEEEANEKALEAVSLQIDLSNSGDDASYENEEYETDNTQEEEN